MRLIAKKSKLLKYEPNELNEWQEVEEVELLTSLGCEVAYIFTLKDGKKVVIAAKKCEVKM